MKAVVLISGGLDSVTTLAIAKEQDYQCYTLSFDYGQRHIVELDAAKKLASVFEVCEHKVVKIFLPQTSGSALTDLTIDVPDSAISGVPITYVPARNTIFLSYALSWAEVLGSTDIFIGVNAVDYSGYPDCRPEYIRVYEELAKLATKSGTEGGANFSIHAPLINLTKSQIIQKGINLGIDYSITVSCYQADPNGLACGRCDSCRFRKQGFNEAGVSDPTLYK